MQKSLITFLFILGIIMVSSGCKTAREVEKTLAMEIADVDLSKVPDGTYQGAHPMGLMHYIVDVTVTDHRIASIDIVDAFSENEYSQKGQAILDSVITYQSLDIDVITGATVTSKAYLAAIKDALDKENQ